ncbi:MAG: hypothetical protein ACOX17_01550 [Christensenellales bacterium]|jgi:hypothetical protein
MKRNIDELIAAVFSAVESHRIADGEYARWLWQDETGSRNLAPSEYGCADAANILYTIGRFPSSGAERKAFVRKLQSFQTPETGLFSEPTHHFMHSTAHCTAALELFDARPLYPIRAYDKFLTREGLYALLESLDWENNAWPEAHKGAGIYAALMNTDAASLRWQNDYFGWLDANCDEKYGVSRRGAIDSRGCAEDRHLYGWFHYMFNYTHSRRPFPHAETLVDTAIRLYRDRDFSTDFGKMIGFCEIDWVYALNRAASQTGYRFRESRRLLREFAGEFLDYLESLDYPRHDGFNDLHMLFGMTCAIAELQLALPGELVSTRPLKSVLDRRPFI